MSKPTNLGLWATTGGTTVEPLLAEKQAGWLLSKKLPARWLNWWMNNQYIWNQWLNDFENTAHTWSELQTFSNGISVTGGAGSAAILATGSGTKHGVFAQGGAGSGAVALRGLGGNGTTVGRDGVLGEGGTGSLLGGQGVFGQGGTSSGGLGGAGGIVLGADIDGATNTAGGAGVGLSAEGGDITSDANNRKGGAALKATGGLGQDGRGPALKAVLGAIEIDDGPITQAALGGGLNTLLDTQITGDLEVTDDLIVGDSATFGGLVTASGGIAMEAPIAVTGGIGFLNSWDDGTGVGGSAVAYWKNPFGMVHMHGCAVGGVTGSVAFVLPTGYRPAAERQFWSKDFATANIYRVNVFTNGEVKITWSGGAGAAILENVCFRAV